MVYFVLIGTFFVAMISTPVFATFDTKTSPIATGAFTVTFVSASVISKIFPFFLSMTSQYGFQHDFNYIKY